MSLPTDDYSGFIILRLSGDLPPISDSCVVLSDVCDKIKLPGLQLALKEFNLTNTCRVVRSQSMKQEKILDIERSALQSGFPPPHSLIFYWRVDARERLDQLEEITVRLNRLNEIELAYREIAVGEPAGAGPGDPYSPFQNYLDAAPEGIDARWAWIQPNGKGAGIGLVDLEQGWFLAHEDYVNKAPNLLFGDNRDGVGTYIGDHGTMVLGVAIAEEDNGIGIKGTAPLVTSVSVSSRYDANTGSNGNVAEAILGALPHMAVGDVLLLEVERSHLPTEIDECDFLAIRLAVAIGIVVVEAAGNGAKDLDTYLDAAGKFILNPDNDTDFQGDSGAIMVGACESNLIAEPGDPTDLRHDRWDLSNYGSRIDCHAWGENVVSCGKGDLDNGVGDRNKTYTDSFGGTSSASVIIAGAALVVQGMYDANTGSRMSPLQMRALLSDSATGTGQGSGKSGNIGVMPNLRAIIEDTLELIPDIYLRDNVGDTGIVPSTGSISASPDIILRPMQVGDPQMLFGEGSGTENSNLLGYEAIAGQDNFVYVRIKNRGGMGANNVTATVYWSEVSTLVTPDMWTKVGTSAPVNVPQGDTLIVTDPITWAAGEIPGSGHYCFVGVLHHASDPQPALPGIMDWNRFLDFIHNLNNVSWRNFNVVDLDAAEAGDAAGFAFLIAGAPDRSRIFDLEIEQHLAPDVRIWIELPIGFDKIYFAQRHFESEVNRRNKTVRLKLPASVRLHFPNLRLPRGARFAAKIIVSEVKQKVKQGNWVAVRQLFEGEEVGRVTWKFHRRQGDEEEFKK